MPISPKFEKPNKRHKYLGTLSEVARFLNMSRSTLEGWNRDKLIEPTPRGKWSTKQILAVAEKRKEEFESSDDVSTESSAYYTEQRKKFQALKEEAEYKKLIGELIVREEVEAAQTAKILVLKNSLLGLGAQLAPRLLGLKSKSEIETIIETKLIDLIEQYASAPDVEPLDDDDEVD